jgi:hypothetical protein
VIGNIIIIIKRYLKKSANFCDFFFFFKVSFIFDLKTFLIIQRCAKTVPYNKSIACSTEFALEWDESFKNNADESGRAVMGVHVQGEKLSGTQ